MKQRKAFCLVRAENKWNPHPHWALHYFTVRFLFKATALTVERLAGDHACCCGVPGSCE